MAASKGEFAVDDLLFVVRSLNARLNADASCDVSAVRLEADTLIIAAKRTLEHNEAARDSLDMARLLLSLGHPELALVKIRGVLLPRRDSGPAPAG
jgi:hypothetical protein